MKTIQVRRTRHAGHCWRSKDELISDVLLWTPTYGCAKAGRPARTYIQQLCEDTGCNPEDLPEAMNDREKWRERVRDIRAGGTTSWWWWWYFVQQTKLAFTKAEVRGVIKICKVCQLISLPLVRRAERHLNGKNNWERVGMDITHYNGIHFLALINCGPSRYTIWRPLRNRTLPVSCTNWNLCFENEIPRGDFNR